jgi:hypothetical protein
LELVDFGLERLDASGGAAQGSHGHAVLQGLGWPVSELGAGDDLGPGGQRAELGAELVGGADDECLELVAGRGSCGRGVTAGGDQDP